MVVVTTKGHSHFYDEYTNPKFPFYCMITRLGIKSGQERI